MRQLCDRAGVAYKRPHAHAVWALSHAGSVADLKAVSQNLMHKSLFTTDEIYGAQTMACPHSPIRLRIGWLKSWGCSVWKGT
jgi:hypothetical protein